MNDVPPITPVLFCEPEARVALSKLTPGDSTGRVADPPSVAEVRAAVVEADVTGDVEQRDHVVEDARRHHLQHLAAWLAQTTQRGYDQPPERLPEDLKAGHAREYRRRMRAVEELVPRQATFARLMVAARLMTLRSRGSVMLRLRQAM